MSHQGRDTTPYENRLLGSESIFRLNRHAPPGAWPDDTVDFVDLKGGVPSDAGT